MNWEAIGAIGEVVGALGVVATLLYLAIQIRQNTKTMRGQALGAVTQNILSEVLPFSGNNIHVVFLKAIEDPESLSNEELSQLDAWYVASFTARQNEFAQFKLGTLSEDIWKSTHQAIRENMGNEYGRRWWDSLGRNRFMPEFVAFIDSLDWREVEGARANDVRSDSTTHQQP